MSLSKTTSLGTITVNDSVISKAIIRTTVNVKQKFFLSTEKGKILGNHSRVTTGDLAGNFSIEEEDGSYKLTIYAVINFGSSIKNVTEEVLDALQHEMKVMFPENGGVIIIKIVGVKSKNIAERDIEVKREYEASR